MARVFSGKPARDIEFAGESLIDPALSGNLPKKNIGLSIHPTVTEQQQTTSQIDDISDKKSHSGNILF